MTTNIIELAPALLRRREGRQQAAQAVRQAPWRSRYRDGIDGLVIRRPTAEIVRLVPSAKLRTGETNHG
jgi:hypothetical protein